MKWLKSLELVERMDQLIRMKATGTSRELAGKLGISKSTVYAYMALMKDLGAPLYYCKKTRSFCYSYEVRFIFGFELDRKNN
jgi:predicted DNA-binding transcriptional regulator YafY